MSNIHSPGSDAEIVAAFPVMAQLRPSLTAQEFVARVRRQRQQGYQLAVLWEGGAVRTVAGYRVCENLCFGRFLYVDDLVTDETVRGCGYGGEMLDWLTARAREAECARVVLDSGTHREAAHRFYRSKGFSVFAYNFALALQP